MTGREEWNARYAEFESVYGNEPNEFFREQLGKLDPGYLLLPGEGEGRNALWAARQGWRVLAFDYSFEALNRALRKFGREGVSVIYSLNNAETFRPFWQFDAIALIYFHLNAAIRKEFHRKVASWLKPNGRVILECFHPDQLGRSSGGPKDPSLFATIDELRSDFETLRIDSLDRFEITLDEGELHRGLSVVTRMVATREE
jgi:hypothetical protein